MVATGGLFGASHGRLRRRALNVDDPVTVDDPVNVDANAGSAIGRERKATAGCSRDVKALTRAVEGLTEPSEELRCAPGGELRQIAIEAAQRPFHGDRARFARATRRVAVLAQGVVVRRGSRSEREVRTPP